MNPAEIMRLRNVAESLSRRSGHSPEAFLLAYVAWEALKIRILIVGMTATGMTVSSARQLISENQIWKGNNYSSLFEKYFGVLPNSSPGVGHLFAKADSCQKIRNGFVHGSKRVDPDSFRKATETIIQLIDEDWSQLLADLLGSSIRRNPLGRLGKSI